MDPGRRQRIADLFARAMDVPPAERAALLRRECEGDPELLAEVESLLSNLSEGFLENPAHLQGRGSTREREEHPTEIGPYRIERVLGSGGMGVVYLAEQVEPVRRQVALKLIKLGMDTRQVVSRFEAERQALAMMNHPNIAGVLDAGATEAGKPYFVMEYVPGPPITEHCDAQCRDTRGRLELFMQACAGIQHAHQKGIIHRDVKASNVLVSTGNGQPVVKIIDFGVAKAIDYQLVEETFMTQAGQFLGTPAYMSPEQAEMSSLGLDTRTDVYSLGVLLYELLVGVLPFDTDELRRSGIDAMRRAIQEQDPPRPSTRFHSLGGKTEELSRNRHTDPGSFEKLLRGDLDWIVMKALEKDRARRYASASELSADIDRFLASEPVTARPPSAGYRLGKFVRRHRVGVTAGMLVLLALLAGVVGTTVGLVRALRAEELALAAEEDARLAANRATEEANTTGRVVKFLVDLFRIADPAVSGGREVTAGELLEQGAVDIREQLQDDPVIRGRIMATIGDVYSKMADYEAARPLLEESLEVLKDTEGGSEAEVARVLNMLANLAVKLEDDQAAVPLYREALAIMEKLHGPRHKDVAAVLKNLGDVLGRLGEMDEARDLQERALEINEELFGENSKEVAISLGSIANLAKEAGDYEAAVPILERSLELRKATYRPEHPRIALGQYFLADTLILAGRDEEAVPYLEEALATWQKVYGETSDYAGSFAFSLAEAHARLGNVDGAEEMFELAMTVDEEVFGPDSPDRIETLQSYAGFLNDVGRAADASAADKEIQRLQSLEAIERTP